MRWASKAKQNLLEWHLWWAWFPVRIPQTREVDGQWVWLEVIFRRFVQTWGRPRRDYALLENKDLL